VTSKPVRLLGELVDIVSGFAFDSSYFVDTGSIPVVRIRDVVAQKSSTYYRGDYDPRFIIHDGDVLIGMDGEFNRARWNGGDALLNQRVCKIVPSSQELDEVYLYHFLPSALKKIEDITPFVTVKHLSVKDIRAIEIPLPPLSEQRRIAELLDRADALRAKRRVALAQLDALTQSIFLDLFGDPKSNPSNWPLSTLSRMFADSPIFGSMIPPVSEPRGWLAIRVGNIQDWKLDLSDRKYVDLPPNEVERHTVKDGDLLLARAIASQAHLGKCVVAHPGSERWAFDSHLMRMRFDRYKIEPEYVRHLFMTPGGRQMFLGASRKSTVQFNINTKEMSRLQIPVPPIEAQKIFLDWVGAVEKLKIVHTASLAWMENLFTSLQYRAFRGEL
jgi:type I restriction enzyme S subunit